MADWWVSVAALEQGVPLLVLPHAEGWLQARSHPREIFRESKLSTGSAMDTGRHQRAVLAGTGWRLPITPDLLHTREGVVMALPAGDHASVSGFYERDVLEAIRAADREGVYLDIGACVGNHTAYFATRCRATRVLAVEPNRVALTYLLVTVERNGWQGRVAVRRLGVHDTWRWASVEQGPVGNLGMARLVSGGKVACQRLDELCEWIGGGVAVVKIDVEGLELAVLRSGPRTLRDKPLLAIEAQTPAAHQGVADLLAAYGYRVRCGPLGSTPTYLWEAT